MFEIYTTNILACEAKGKGQTPNKIFQMTFSIENAVFWDK